MTEPVTGRPPTVDELEEAWAAVRRALPPTPMVPAPLLGPNVRLKLETLQPTGSFKVRGALAALSRLPPGANVVTASTGNHALGVAYAAEVVGLRATVVVPATVSPAKLAGLSALPVEVVRHGATYGEAEAHALRIAAAGGRYLSPYNDPHVMAGQATLGRELGLRRGRRCTIVCGVGGGGLASGLGLWAATARRTARIVGVESRESPAMSAATRAGRTVRVEVGETIADGLAGNLQPGSVTVSLVREHVAGLVAVSDEEIEAAIRYLAGAHGLVVEGAGAAPVAALMTNRVPGGDDVIAVVGGRNIELAAFARVMNG